MCTPEDVISSIDLQFLCQSIIDLCFAEHFILRVNKQKNGVPNGMVGGAHGGDGPDQARQSANLDPKISLISSFFSHPAAI
jgi:hypothetical protein